MNTKKVLLGSLALAGAITACTNEEIIDVAQNDAMLSERTQVNLTLTAPSVGSRMAQTDDGYFTYTKNDVVGAVLVDAGYSNDTPDPTNNVWNNVDWNVVDGHVGNNRWAYNKDEHKFMTEGTTSVGSWLFYTKYNADMTKTRNGVTFGFPQIQDGAADYSKVYNNNINFMISPVVHIDGYEGQNLEFDIAMASVHSYLKMPFNFKALENVTKVQKIIVTAKNTSLNPVSFPTKYVVKNANLPEARLSLAEGAIEKIACVDLNSDSKIDLADMNEEMSNKVDSLQYQKYSAGANKTGEWAIFVESKYKPLVEGIEGALDKLVVDFESSHDDEVAQNGGLDVKDGLFDAWMLMPAGVYGEISFEIYTNDGVYSVSVGDRNAYRVNANEGLEPTDPSYIPAVGEGLIFLRPNKQVTISDVEAVVDAGEVEYIKVTLADKTTGKLVTKTSDLINFINGIKDEGNHEIFTLTQNQIGENNGVDDAVLPEHKLIIINQAVMDAIEEKEAALQKDIQLIFKDAEIVIEGNEEDALDIHDLTFDKNAKITKGLVKATADVQLRRIAGVADSRLTIGGNSTLELSMNNNSNSNLNKITVEEGSKLVVNSNNKIYSLTNQGNVVIGSKDNNTASIEAYNFNNQGVTRNFGDLTVNGDFTNNEDARFITAGNLTINKTANAKNNGAIENSSKINVKGSLTNSNIITVGTTGEIVVNSDTAGSLINETTGEITNNGDIYTVVETGATNFIYNYGLINAKEGSLTYITRNSYEDEKSSKATNEDGQKMGTIRMDKRDANMSVTEKNFQGYKEYTVNATDLTEGVLSAVAKDKFNKIVLRDAAELSAEVAAYVRYIETSGTSLTLPSGARIQEATFASDVEFYCEPKTAITEKAVIAKLTVKEGVKLTVPTENEMNVTDITGLANSKTKAQISNQGTILVGGNFYTNLAKDATKTANPNGVFASGHGGDTAFHWSYF